MFDDVDPECARNHDSVTMIATETGEEAIDQTQESSQREGGLDIGGALDEWKNVLSPLAWTSTKVTVPYQKYTCPACNRTIKAFETESGVQIVELQEGDL